MMKMKNMNVRKNSAGFTLIEITIVLLISSVIIAGFFAAFNLYLHRVAIEKTKDRKAQIEQALNAYVSANFALPCPAPINGVTMDDPTYGQRTACLGGPVPAGTYRVKGRNNNNVHIGAIPAFDLGDGIDIPLEAMVDGWGNLFTYAVTEDMTAPGSITSFDEAYDMAAIEVRENNRTLSPPDPDAPSNIPPGHVAYIVISHGSQGTGAFTPYGVRGSACPNAATLDGQNCDYEVSGTTTEGIPDEAVFVAGTGFSLGENPAYFDDVVSYASRITAANWPEHRWCNPGTGVLTGIQFKNADLSWGPCSDLRGPLGPVGIKGPTGDPGAQGPPGGLSLSDALCPDGEALRGFTATGTKICVTNDGTVPDFTATLYEQTKVVPRLTIDNSVTPNIVTVNQPFATASCNDDSVRVSCSGARDDAVLDSSNEEDGGYMGTVNTGTHDCKTGVDFNGGIEAVATAYCLRLDY
jgi:prepilin-type N-terminal cleavage/methylation domain-containing protein